MNMVNNNQSQPTKTLEKSSKGIRSGFGLFRRPPEPKFMIQDQEIFVRRLEEVLDPEPVKAGYAPEPPRTFNAPPADVAQPAAPVFASAPIMEPV
ncbi:MAG: hypothetical protein ABSD67_01470 [Terracidiphilus sp.]|jgi:hypothetical protein